MVEFRKRIDDEVLAQINEMIIAYNTPDDLGPCSGGEPYDGSNEGSENRGTIILDAICAPQDISYPQDVNLQSEARENLESLTGRICQVYGQQQYMYENNTHTVSEHIVSTSQPYIRPIVRGKVVAPVEFGAKHDLSIDGNELAFSLAKRCYGFGKIMTKLNTTTRGSITLSILTMNVDCLVSLS